MGKRFETPRQGEQYRSEYDMPSDLLTDLQGRDVSPLFLVTLDLSTAGSKFIQVPGRAVVPYFFVTNSVQKTRQPAGQVTIYVNQTDASNPFFGFPAKHNRGFRGTFSQLYVTWTAQGSTSVDLVLLRSENTPWMSDDIDPDTFTSGVGQWNTVEVLGAYTFTPNDTVALIDTSGGNCLVTLENPDQGKISVVKNFNGGGAITLVSQAGETIDGASSQTLNSGDSMMVVGDGANWWIIG